MSTETHNEITIIPPEVKVTRHVRKVYACRHCEREEIRTPIVTAPMPKPVYPGSLASPSSIAYVMSQKYVYSQPLYRHEQQFARLGLVLSRQTLAGWMLYGADKWLSLLVRRMFRNTWRPCTYCLKSPVPANTSAVKIFPSPLFVQSCCAIEISESIASMSSPSLKACW
ncbi:transposase [Paenibacillus xanthanilyticus]|uniref:Transposase n=1 Tax=Paenibacillus xanthanilyticus TaxID=1783531 RepID=A0ABV8K7T1_9BACL